MEGFDHFEIFAQTVLFEVMLLYVRMFVLRGWHINHMDNRTAFLKEDINEELYVSWNEVVR